MTCFNLFAGGASFGGLIISYGFSEKNSALIIIFMICLAISIYVLVIPENRLERNVRTRIRKFFFPFENEDFPDHFLLQRGDFEISPGV